MKIVNYSWNIIKFSLLSLMILISILIPVSFFELKSIITEIEFTESTINENKTNENKTIRSYEILFKNDSWEKTDVPTLLLGILSSSAAIVAVAFTITQIIISNVSQKYSPKVLEIYLEKTNPASSFVSLILTVSGATILLLIYNIMSPELQVVLTIIVVNGFLISLLLFANNFKMVFRVISPYYFMEDIKDMVLEKMSEGNDDKK